MSATAIASQQIALAARMNEVAHSVVADIAHACAEEAVPAHVQTIVIKTKIVECLSKPACSFLHVSRIVRDNPLAAGGILDCPVDHLRSAFVQVRLIPVWAFAGLPLFSAEVAKLGPADAAMEF